MKYFNVTQEEIEKKLFNIFIGISLGNKLLTKDLAKKYIKWAYENTRDHVLVLIADDIDTINWEVFRDFTKEEAEQKVKTIPRYRLHIFALSSFVVAQPLLDVLSKNVELLVAS